MVGILVFRQSENSGVRSRKPVGLCWAPAAMPPSCAAQTAATDVRCSSPDSGTAAVNCGLFGHAPLERRRRIMSFVKTYERSIRRAEKIRDQAISSGDFGKAQAWQTILDARSRRSLADRFKVAELRPAEIGQASQVSPPRFSPAAEGAAAELPLGRAAEGGIE